MLEKESGYNSRRYIESLSEFGTPAELPNAAGYCLVRRIRDSNFYDAMGAYPILSCRRWQNIGADFELLQQRLVSFSAVVDPLAECDAATLSTAFPDLVLPFKRHHIIDFNRPLTVCAHHRRNIRKALARLEIEVSDGCGSPVGDWLHLYSHVVQKYKIGDLRAFSECAFERLFQTPDLRVFRAVYQGATVGMILWIEQNDCAYYHLGAYSADGYACNASFALFDAAIEYFRSRQCRFLNLGAGAGMVCNDDDGLTRFKRGWANGERTAYFCGRILNHHAYAELLRDRPQSPTSYFPAYRQGEFCKKQPQAANAEALL